MRTISDPWTRFSCRFGSRSRSIFHPAEAGGKFFLKFGKCPVGRLRFGAAFARRPASAHPETSRASSGRGGDIQGENGRHDHALEAVGTLRQRPVHAPPLEIVHVRLGPLARTGHHLDFGSLRCPVRPRSSRLFRHRVAIEPPVELGLAIGTAIASGRSLPIRGAGASSGLPRPAEPRSPCRPLAARSSRPG